MAFGFPNVEEVWGASEGYVVFGCGNFAWMVPAQDWEEKEPEPSPKELEPTG